jgi:hypothetical protein
MSAWTLSPKPASLAALVAKVAVLGMLALVAGCAAEEREGKEGAEGKEGQKPQRRSLPPSNGTHNDLTIICPEGLWKEAAGLAVAEILGAPVAGLPQAEPRFGIIHAVPQKINSLLRRGKSLLSIEVIPDSTAVLEVRDAYARPQMAVQVIAPSLEALPSLLAKVLPELGNRFAAHDAQVLRQKLKARSQSPLPKELRKIGVAEMLLPEGFLVTLSKPGLVVLRMQTKKSQQYLILSQKEADDSPTPEADVIVDRDVLLKSYFEGTAAKSHLATELLVPPTQAFYTAANGQRALRTAGLFKTVGGFGGGPFVSHRVFDDAAGSVVTADALLFAPSVKKYRLLMELDEITASVRWGESSQK